MVNRQATLKPGGTMPVDIEKKVIEIIAEQGGLDVADVHFDSTFDSLGIDSLGVVQSIFAIEETFDIGVPFNANTPEGYGVDMASVAAVIAAVKDLIAQKAG